MKNNNGKNQQKSKKLCDRVVCRIMNCTLEDLRTITVKNISKEFQVSKMYLIKSFRTHRNITPGRFIARYKMLRAKSLMEKNEKLTVKEITEIFGFSSSNYFIRIFKDYFGLPPCQYREFNAKQDNDLSYKQQGRE
jgi:2-isopropylmalate synthase